ncbi:MAG TPA: Gfo/Idh/MocA family oxidoreductase [bacterium]|nr:Gfo/Idh/MocA family oxidoreductase [bacterium]
MPDKRKNTQEKTELSRRDFFQSAAATGVGLFFAGKAFAQNESSAAPSAAEIADASAAATGPKPDELRVAIIGPGSQGRMLMMNALKIPAIRFVAVCDIWPYNQLYSSNILKKYDQPCNVYTDYQEMLAQEKDLDAVIVATPDWVHAEHAVACLKAGLHVYCEKEMSRNLENAKEMVLAARETGKLLQIGHQRRSNPRYLHAMKLIEKDKVLGRITHVQGQWNRPVTEDLGWPKGKELDQATLEKYGYESMHQFANWRWFKKYSGGPISDLGSHQVDIFNWFLKTTPSSVQATGGLDFYTNREWYDNVLTLYDYKSADGPVRGFYQVMNTCSYGGFYELFLGTEGALMISEDERRGFMFREVAAKKREWEDEAEKVENMGQEAIALKIGETLKADGTKSAEAEALMAEAQKPTLQLHLENFFNAIRNGTPLTSPAEIGYETAVCVLRVNEALEKGTRVDFKPDDFKV